MGSKREAEVGRDGIDDRHLRSALEYAVTIAAETAKRKPPMESPTALRSYFGLERLPTGALGRVRRAIEADDTFRARIAAGAIPALVDEVGRLWLQRPEGWRAKVDDVLAATAAEEQARGVERALRKEEKRRRAAERATQRAVADLVASEAAAEAARAEAIASASEVDALRAELSRAREDLTAARTEARHERDRRQAAADKLAATREELAAIADGAGDAPDAAERDELERLRREESERERTLGELRAAVVSAAASAGRLGEELRRLVDGAQVGGGGGASGSGGSGSGGSGSAGSGSAGSESGASGSAVSGSAGLESGASGSAGSGSAGLESGASGSAVSGSAGLESVEAAASESAGSAGSASGSAGASSGSAGSAGASSGSADQSSTSDRGRRRRPLKLPGGVRAASVEAAEFLLRSGASVYVDGYNVAMLAWPDRALCDQRETLIVSAENAARRFGSSLTIVFDGADVIGGFAPTRRDVRIVYSPESVTADDVIRSEVGRFDPSVPIVVVTDDAEIVRDVKQVGANVISSSTFAELL